MIKASTLKIIYKTGAREETFVSPLSELNLISYFALCFNIISFLNFWSNGFDKLNTGNNLSLT